MQILRFKNRKAFKNIALKKNIEKDFYFKYEI